MGHFAPSPERDIKAIFKEKVFGTYCFLVSAETIEYLKWLIYTALFKDGELHCEQTRWEENLGTPSTTRKNCRLFNIWTTSTGV